MDFFIGGSMNYYKLRTDKLKRINDTFISNRQLIFSLYRFTLIDRRALHGFPGDYCNNENVLISCLESHSHGTHSLQDPLVDKWMLKSVLIKKNGLGEYIFSQYNFCVNYSYKVNKYVFISHAEQVAFHSFH